MSERLRKLTRGLYAIHDLPAAFIPRYSAILVADIHLGFEEEMASKGIFLPRMQVKRAAEVIQRCLELTSARRLIIVGDLKHLFERLGRREAKDVREFLERVVPMFRSVVLIRGNHDTFVYIRLREFGVDVVDELLIDDMLIVHGHRRPSIDGGYSILVMGHEHPSIAIRDPLGTVAKLPCFLVVPLSNGATAVVLPALGMYQSGTSVSTSPEAYLSPILRSLAILEEAKPYAIVEGEGAYELPKLGLIEGFLQATL
ncbi:MAG: metallophosphoesterase [Crenarchaeota archaeon]|nr:metallophosphoesterase [Thermoproteota archaeon]